MGWDGVHFAAVLARLVGFWMSSGDGDGDGDGDAAASFTTRAVHILGSSKHGVYRKEHSIGR